MTQGVFSTAPVIVFGGVAGRATRGVKTEGFLKDKPWADEKVLQDAITMLGGELQADPYTPRREYRQSLVASLFYKAYLALGDPAKLPARLRTAAAAYERPVSSGSVSFDTDPSEYPVSKPLHKLSARIQTTGEAQYLDDLPLRADALHAAYVMSTQANATIDVIDASAALSMRGVRGFVSAASMIKDGYGNMVGEYECLLAAKKVDYFGQAIGLVVADSYEHAHDAAQMVDVTYKDVSKPVLTIQEAIEADSLFKDSYRELKTGDVSKGFAAADVIVEGHVSLGHAYHFHLETQRAEATPGEEGAVHIVSSSQNPSQVQAVAANVLNVPQHKVSVTVKRVGGAFGAKINRSAPVAAATALAADKFGRPVRTVLDLSTNMQMVGGRNPYYVKYKAGATGDGKLTAVQMAIYMDQGHAFDFDGTDIAGLFIFFDNVYRSPAWRLEGWVARTNLPVCTFMRAPGTLEGIYVIEHVIEHVAHKLGIPADDVRERNFYRKGDVTPFGQTLNYCNAQLVYDMVKESSGYHKRRADVQEFNKANRWVKRGISLVPTRFIVAWSGCPFSALLNVYPDGSVRIDTSGVEMGQGLNTKVAQVAAYAMGKFAKGGVPLAMIRVGPTSTLVANNSFGTESSIGSELCSKATQEACARIAESLKIARRACLAESEEPTWQQLVGKAVDLGLTLQSTARVDEEPPPWGPFQYMSYGAAVTEAEADVLTGEWRIRRADILLDAGKSLNPAIDVGQIQGGYIMGLGNLLCEEMLYDDAGKNISDTTWEYKVPSSQDIPVDFHVALLQNSGNPSGFLRSKCSGEPPTAMATRCTNTALILSK